MFGEVEDIQLGTVLTVNKKAAFDLPFIIMWDKAVDAMPDRALSAAGRTCDHNLFAFFDTQIDIVKGRFSLGTVLKAEIFEFDSRDGVHK